MNRPPVFAAVPNHNMGNYLEDLLPRLKENNYDGIYVLDDMSTDHSRDIVKQEGDVTLITHPQYAKTNGHPLGAAATRNLMLERVHERAAIHFIDADTMPEKIDMQTVEPEALGQGFYPITAGLVRSKDGRQHVFNHGAVMSARNDLAAAVHAKTYDMARTNPQRARRIRSRLPHALWAFPDPFSEPMRRDVDWGLESNLIINAGFFNRLKGFDGTLREHEIQDFVIRANKATNFEPGIALTHLEGDVRGYNRTRAMIDAEAKIIAKHGLWKWWVFNKRSGNRGALI